MPVISPGADTTQAGHANTKQLENLDKPISESVSKNTTYATSKQLMNIAILSAQQEVNFSAIDEPLILLYRAAIEAIDNKLTRILGFNAIQTAYENGVDNSPEATSERVVSFATQFFGLYQEQNSGMSFDDQLSEFMDIIGGAIDQGFGEARDILTNLKVLEGEIAEGVDQTYSLVRQGLQEFRDSFYPDSISDLGQSEPEDIP